MAGADELRLDLLVDGGTSNVHGCNEKVEELKATKEKEAVDPLHY